MIELWFPLQGCRGEVGRGQSLQVRGTWSPSVSLAMEWCGRVRLPLRAPRTARRPADQPARPTHAGRHGDRRRVRPAHRRAGAAPRHRRAGVRTPQRSGTLCGRRSERTWRPPVTPAAAGRQCRGAGHALATRRGNRRPAAGAPGVHRATARLTATAGTRGRSGRHPERRHSAGTGCRRVHPSDVGRARSGVGAAQFASDVRPVADAGRAQDQGVLVGHHRGRDSAWRTADGQRGAHRGPEDQGQPDHQGRAGRAHRPDGRHVPPTSGPTCSGSSASTWC